MEASKLKQVLDQHKLWVDGKGGKRANLTGASLVGADLNGANLECASLRGADLTDADLEYANLQGADLRVANLRGANLKDAILRGAVLSGAYLKDATGLPNVSWIIPGCLVHLNNIMDHIFYHGFYLQKEDKWENFVQDSLGFFIQDNPIEKTFDMLAGDRIIRNIPDWVKLSGLKQIESV